MQPDLLYRPDFLTDSGSLLATLQASVIWDERLRARKTASFGEAYDYSQIRYEWQAMPEILAQIAQAMAPIIGFVPNNCLINYYPDGESSMGFHSDALDQLAPYTGVAILSLGASRQSGAVDVLFPVAPGRVLGQGECGLAS